jgi:hypothetical protein
MAGSVTSTTVPLFHAKKLQGASTCLAGIESWSKRREAPSPPPSSPQRSCLLPHLLRRHHRPRPRPLLLVSLLRWQPHLMISWPAWRLKVTLAGGCTMA